MRDLRVEDAHTINNHLPLIAARLAAPEKTPEKVTVIANEVQFIPQLQQFRG